MAGILRTIGRKFRELNPLAGGVKTFHINLDNPFDPDRQMHLVQTSDSDDTHISGTILVEVEEDTQVKEIVVELWAYERITGKSSHSLSFKYMVAHPVQVLVRNDYPNVYRDGHGLLFGKGRHAFRFSVIIPSDALLGPSGVIGTPANRPVHTSSIHYQLKASIVKPWKIDVQKAPLYVIPFVDCSPAQRTPVENKLIFSTNHTLLSKLIAFFQGKVSNRSQLDISLESFKFWCDEPIKVSFALRNGTNMKEDTLNVVLMETISMVSLEDNRNRTMARKMKDYQPFSGFKSFSNSNTQLMNWNIRLDRNGKGFAIFDLSKISFRFPSFKTRGVLVEYYIVCSLGENSHSSRKSKWKTHGSANTFFKIGTARPAQFAQDDMFFQRPYQEEEKQMLFGEVQSSSFALQEEEKYQKQERNVTGTTDSVYDIPPAISAEEAWPDEPLPAYLDVEGEDDDESEDVYGSVEYGDIPIPSYMISMEKQSTNSVHAVKQEVVPERQKSVELPGYFEAAANVVSQKPEQKPEQHEWPEAPAYASAVADQESEEQLPPYMLS